MFARDTGAPMSDWSAGYTTDINYTYGYYHEFNPQRIRFSLLAAGIVPPDITTACELGFGQGISVNIHAAASSVKWYGTDFNPSQASFAQSLGLQSGADIHLSDDSFLRFVDREDLPTFDFIGLHGIWSWITAENRNAIVRFLDKKLKAGGVCYISYNAMPGWAAFAPIQKLLSQHAEVMSFEGQFPTKKIEEALKFVDQMFSLRPHFLEANPIVKERFEKLKTQNKNYLIHEYYNREWCPQYFSEMVTSLAPAKMQFAASANLFDHASYLNLNSEQLQFLDSLPNKVYQESVKDYLLNTQFRKDYWIKGARHLTVFERAKLLKETRLILAVEPKEIPKTVPTRLGQAILNPNILQPIADFLSEKEETSIAELTEIPHLKAINFNQVIQVLIVLAGMGTIQFVQDRKSIDQAKSSSHRLNQGILDMSIGASDIDYLASPVTGGAVPLDRFHRLCVAAYKTGLTTEDSISRFIWETLSPIGIKMLKDGKVLNDSEENKMEIKKKVAVFLKDKLHFVKKMGIVD